MSIMRFNGEKTGLNKSILSGFLNGYPLQALHTVPNRVMRYITLHGVTA